MPGGSHCCIMRRACRHRAAAWLGLLRRRAHRRRAAAVPPPPDARRGGLRHYAVLCYDMLCLRRRPPTPTPPTPLPPTLPCAHPPIRPPAPAAPTPFAAPRTLCGRPTRARRARARARITCAHARARRRPRTCKPSLQRRRSERGGAAACGRLPHTLEPPALRTGAWCGQVGLCRIPYVMTSRGAPLRRRSVCPPCYPPVRDGRCGRPLLGGLRERGREHLPTDSVGRELQVPQLADCASWSRGVFENITPNARRTRPSLPQCHSALVSMRGEARTRTPIEHDAMPDVQLLYFPLLSSLARGGSELAHGSGASRAGRHGNSSRCHEGTQTHDTHDRRMSRGTAARVHGPRDRSHVVVVVRHDSHKVPASSRGRPRRRRLRARVQADRGRGSTARASACDSRWRAGRACSAPPPSNW